MPTEISSSTGDAAGEAPRPIPDYETAITSLRRRLHAGGADERSAAAADLRLTPPRDAGQELIAASGGTDHTARAALPRKAFVVLGLVAVCATAAAALAWRGSRAGARRSDHVSAAASAPLSSSAHADATAAAGPSDHPTTAAPVSATRPPGDDAQAAPEQTDSDALGSLEPSERRSLRRHLMRACDEQRWADGLQAGQRLREHDALDWGATLCLASVLRNAGRTGDARALYRAFLERFPHNRHVKDAREALIELGEGAPGAGTAPVGAVRAP